MDPFAAVVGTYTLTQINASPLPVLYYQNSAGRIDFISGTFVVRADHSYTETQNLRTTYTSGAAPQMNAVVENGTVSLTGSQLTYSIPQNGTSPSFSYTGAYSAGVVTYTYGGFSYLYKK